MQGKTVVITGGNAGIGKEAAVGLATLGARVIITSRNEQRGRAAWKEIVERSGNSDVEVMALDLASFRSIRTFAAEVIDSVDSEPFRALMEPVWADYRDLLGDELVNSVVETVESP